MVQLINALRVEVIHGKKDNFQKSIARFCRAQEDADDPPSIDEIRDVVRDAHDKSDLGDVLQKLHVRRRHARSRPLLEPPPRAFRGSVHSTLVSHLHARLVHSGRFLGPCHFCSPSRPRSQEMNDLTQKTISTFSDEFKTLHEELADLRNRNRATSGA